MERSESSSSISRYTIDNGVFYDGNTSGVSHSNEVAHRSFLRSLRVGNLVGTNINGKIRKGILRMLWDHEFILERHRRFDRKRHWVAIEVDLPKSELTGITCLPASDVAINYKGIEVQTATSYFIFITSDKIFRVQSKEEKICLSMGVNLQEVISMLGEIPLVSTARATPMFKPLINTRFAQKKNALCTGCKNNDLNKFVTDKKSGDVTCLQCGVVAISRQVHDGEWTRNFEGEVNRSQHGAKPDPLMSSGFNLRTRITGDDRASKSLRRSNNYVEMNLSTFGHEDRRTRTGYKDNMKREAFETIRSIQDDCDLDEPIINLAKILFSSYRDKTEAVRAKETVIAACLVKSLRWTIEQRKQDARRIALQMKTEKDNKLAISLLPHFRCDCVWEWESAPGLIDQKMVAKRRTLKVPKYKLQRRTDVQGSIGSSGGGDGKGYVEVWAPIQDSKACEALEERWKFKNEKKRLDELHKQGNLHGDNQLRYSNMCKSIITDVSPVIRGVTYNASFHGEKAVLSLPIVKSEDAGASPLQPLHIRLAIKNVSFNPDITTTKNPKGRKKLGMGSGLISKSRSRSSGKNKGVFCKLRFNISKPDSSRNWTEILETRIYDSQTTISSSINVPWCEHFFVELDQGCTVKSIEVKLMREAVPRPRAVARGLIRFKSQNSDFEGSSTVTAFSNDKTIIPLNETRVQLYSDVSASSYEDPTGDVVGFVTISGWHSQLRRRVGCYAKFTSLKALRFHKCSSNIVTNSNANGTMSQNLHTTAVATEGVAAQRNRKKRKLSSRQERGLKLYKEI